MTVYYRCKDGMRNDFIKALEAENMAYKCQQEDGNVQYDYFLPMNDDNKTVLLLEKWTTEEAQRRHTTTDHFKKLGELKALFVEEVVIERTLSE